MVFKEFNFILFISNYVIPDQSSVFYTKSRSACAFITRGRGHRSFFYHGDTSACITLTDRIYSTQTLVYGDGFQYWMDSVISSCEDIKRCNPSYVDGEYWLYPVIYNHTRVKIYCYGLSSSQPKEYVTLHYLNKAVFPHYKYSGPSQNCGLNTRLIPQQHGETEWNKIRLNIDTGDVVADYKFTTQTSGIQISYGVAFACSNIVHYLSCPKRGYALVDVRDTGFKLSSSSKWKAGGFKAYCDIERSNYGFEGRGDGDCGGCLPDGKLNLEVDSSTGKRIGWFNVYLSQGLAITHPNSLLEIIDHDPANSIAIEHAKYILSVGMYVWYPLNSLEVLSLSDLQVYTYRKQ